MYVDYKTFCTSKVLNTIDKALNRREIEQSYERGIVCTAKKETWGEIPQSKGKKTIGCRWVFSIKSMLIQ